MPFLWTCVPSMKKHTRSEIGTLLKLNSAPTTRARGAKKRESTIVLEGWTEEGRPDNSADYEHPGKTLDVLLKMKLTNRRTENRWQQNTSRLREWLEIASFTVLAMALGLWRALDVERDIKNSQVYWFESAKKQFPYSDFMTHIDQYATTANLLRLPQPP